jgi:hypothetical protein
MERSAAETLALKGLAFLASEGDALTRFLTLSGLNPYDLRARAADPLLLAAVLDFILQDDRLALRFAEGEGFDPRLMHEARQALPGG